VLEQLFKYDRAVGYFTASGLSLAARGIAELLKNNGKMRLMSALYSLKMIEIRY